MPTRTVTCALVGLLLSLFPVTPARGAEPTHLPLEAPAAGASAAPLQVGAALVVHFPGVSPARVDQAVATSGTGATPAPAVIRLEAADPRFLETLRRQMLVTGLPGIDPAFRELCRPGAPTVPTLLNQADEALDFLDLETAGALLHRTRTAFACGAQPVTGDQLSRWLLLAAVLHLQRKTGDAATVDRFLVDAISIQPQMTFPSQYSTEVKQAFSRARKSQALLPRVPVVLESADLAGLELRIDGVQPAGDRLSLPPGRHFLQLVDQSGQAVGGLEVELVVSSSGMPVAWPPAELRPATSDAVLERLMQGATRGELEPAILTALGNLLESFKGTGLTLIVPGPDPQSALALSVSPSMRIERRMLQAPVAVTGQLEVPRRSRSRAALIATAGFGAATLVSAGYYLAALQQANEPIRDPDARDRIYTVGVVAQGATALCLTGTLISAGLTWFGARSAATPTRTAMPAFRLELSPRALAVRLEGRW